MITHSRYGFISNPFGARPSAAARGGGPRAALRAARPVGAAAACGAPHAAWGAGASPAAARGARGRSLLDPQANYAADVVREVRGRHSGETHTVRIARDLEEDDYQDANLFDEDYTIAATTGFSVWEGAHLILDLMLGKPRVDGANDCGSRGGIGRRRGR